MVKITFKTLADKYNLFEEDVERIFQSYDTNEMDEMKSNIGYCCIWMGSSKHSKHLRFLFDIVCYIKQCEIESVTNNGE